MNFRQFFWEIWSYVNIVRRCPSDQVECGCQGVGGLSTDAWKRDSTDWVNPGYPIVEVSQNGDILMGKPAGTGGEVSRLAAAEQLLYEIGDPSKYIVPDVVCDWRNVKITEEKDPGDHNSKLVRVRGARGSNVPDDLKVCCVAVSKKLWQVSFPLLIVGIDATEKARKVAAALKARAEMLTGIAFRGKIKPEFTEPDNWHIELLGARPGRGSQFFPVKLEDQSSEVGGESYEIVLRIAARHEIGPIGILLKEVGSSVVGYDSSSWEQWVVPHDEKIGRQVVSDDHFPQQDDAANVAVLPRHV